MGPGTQVHVQVRSTTDAVFSMDLKIRWFPDLGLMLSVNFLALSLDITGIFFSVSLQLMVV